MKRCRELLNVDPESAALHKGIEWSVRVLIQQLNVTTAKTAAQKDERFADGQVDACAFWWCIVCTVLLPSALMGLCLTLCFSVGCIRYLSTLFVSVSPCSSLSVYVSEYAATTQPLSHSATQLLSHSATQLLSHCFHRSSTNFGIVKSSCIM